MARRTVARRFFSSFVMGRGTVQVRNSLTRGSVTARGCWRKIAFTLTVVNESNRLVTPIIGMFPSNSVGVQERVGQPPEKLSCQSDYQSPILFLLLLLAHFCWTVENFYQHLARSGPTGFVCIAGEPRLYHTPVEDGMGCNFIIRGE